MVITETQDLHDPARPSVAPPRRGHLGRAVLASMVGLALAGTATVGSAAAQPSAPATASTAAAVNTGKIYFGVDGTHSQAAQGQNVARHVYGQLKGSVPDSRMVTMGIGRFNYSSVATAAPGSTIYTNIVRWADTIKSRGTLTFFGFVHEPEANDQAHYGSASQYIAAYQHVVTIMRAQNVPNVKYVWQMTAYGFVRSGNANAANYYPGDSFVDYVAGDAYNWGGCGGGGPWRDLSVVANPVLEFAKAHGKVAMLSEFGSETGSKRAAWLASAQKYLIANRSQIVAAFYFDHAPTTQDGADCKWILSSAADISAFRAIADNTAYFTS